MYGFVDQCPRGEIDKDLICSHVNNSESYTFIDKQFKKANEIPDDIKIIGSNLQH